MDSPLTSQHFRKRARECRLLAGTLRDGELRGRMMSIADEYDCMAAERLEARASITASRIAAGRHRNERPAGAVSLKPKHGRN